MCLDIFFSLIHGLFITNSKRVSSLEGESPRYLSVIENPGHMLYIILNVNRGLLYELG